MRDIRSLFVVNNRPKHCIISSHALYAPPQDSGVELALGTAVEERVQLVEQEAVWVVGFRRLNVVLIA